MRQQSLCLSWHYISMLRMCVYVCVCVCVCVCVFVCVCVCVHVYYLQLPVPKLVLAARDRQAIGHHHQPFRGAAITIDKVQGPVIGCLIIVKQLQRSTWRWWIIAWLVCSSLRSLCVFVRARNKHTHIQWLHRSATRTLPLGATP